MEWILCEDRLPKNDDWKIITILDEHGDTPYRYSDFGWYFDKAKCWIVDAEPRTDVLAWMSLPLPYNADRKDEPQTDYNKGLQLFAEMLFDKEKSEQFLKECKAMGIEPQTERSE